MDDIVNNIALFRDFTGCNQDDEARFLLESCENNLQLAIDQYYSLQNQQSRTRNEHSRNQGAERPSTSTSNSRRPVPIYHKNRDTMELDDDDTINLSDDETNSNDNGMDEDGIRAPIAPIQGPLVHGTFRQQYQSRVRSVNNPIFEQFHDLRALEADQHREILNQRNNQPGPSNALDTRKAKTLAQLFRPPIDLMFVGEWEKVRAEAVRRKVWLIVNIQKSAEFKSQMLNRDIWANSAVREIVKSNFVLWQVYSDSPSGIRITGYYYLNEFPAVFIVDPRMGEAIQHIQYNDAVVFLEELTSFLDQYPTYDARDKFVAHAASTSALPNKTKRTQNGITKSGNLNRKRSSSKDGQFEGLLDGAKKTKIDHGDDVEALCQDGTKLTTVDKDEWKKFIGDISNHSKKVHIIMRLPDGRREKIALYSTTKLKAIFVFIDGQGLSSHDHLLVLSYPTRIYSINDKENTLEELQFNAQELIDIEKK